eukprot:gnl/TRDRNA2_/TRDRNA2_179175_c0_seq1.p1 gnl/TRDRNA2_/TRDRNA2_179175_c0~~gnl/TRDRNA2_/TRDRNA2_179175_c0_seq1.p1  ORF type:complete len:280 (+),score=58.24 gnl/TRDRNA2_/TRDRNA2_179175_c0_seq1:43-882(+)
MRGTSFPPPGSMGIVKEPIVYDEDLFDSEHLDRRGMLTLFPAMFTMICLMLFLVPSYIVLSIAYSKVVEYWMGKWFYVTYVIPFIIAGTHYIHVKKRAPYKPTVIIALVIPSLILLLLSNGQMIEAMDKSDKLFSVDCDTFANKRQLQISWEAARDLYDNCLQESAKKSGFSVKTLSKKFKVQDCEEYSDALHKHRKDWEYLRYLEEEHRCSGWCGPGGQLWSAGATKDSCSVAVSTVFENSVEEPAMQVCIAMLCSLGFTAFVLILIGPILRRHNFAW